MLSGGDRRGIGRSNELAQALQQGACDARHAVALLFDSDPVIRMRAGDALEKASLANPGLIAPFGRELLDLLCQEEQMEVRWHLARMAPRLPLKASDRRRAVEALKRYLQDRSSIVRTWALDALTHLAAREASIKDEIKELLREAERSGTPAMRARARRLLRESEKTG